MWNLRGFRSTDKHAMTRRAMLRVGGLAPWGLGLPQLLAADAAAGTSGSFGRARRCLMLFMWGAPSHIDLFDMKPQAPAEIRGEFRPVSTAVPGFQVCEHLPQFSRHTDKMALIRSVTHTDNNHSTSAHWMLTGHKHERSAENFNARDSDFPHIGSVLSKLAPGKATLPTFVSLPEVIATTAGAVTPGQGGGILGRRYDPFCIQQHPDEPDFEVGNLSLPRGLGGDRMQQRTRLLERLDRRRDLRADGEVAVLDSYREQALDLITSPDAQRAFDLAREKPAMRERYGPGTFGQSLLLARRLLEAGVRLVTVYWHREMPGGTENSWDTHSKNFIQLKNRLLPQVDGPLATMFEDFGQRGLLDDTLIVWNSEFGRTPKINNNQAGRDHWGPCNSLWLAGAGIAGGQIYGRSDNFAARPTSDPVSPADFSATIYHLLGLPPETVIYDPLQRPMPISTGRPLRRVIG